MAISKRGLCGGKVHLVQSQRAAQDLPFGFLLSVPGEGSLQEAMRLWPTTPVLARASLRRDRLGDDEIPAGSQVVVFTQYLHRDTSRVPDADRFNPERWHSGRDNPQFNHLSNGKQICAGKNLALFLGTAALARLVSRGYVLESPGIDLEQPIPPAFNYFRLRFDRAT